MNRIRRFAMHNPKLFTLMIGVILTVWVAIAAVVVQGWRNSGYWEVLKMNPKSHELSIAFKAWEQETGKSANEMTYWDIAQYVRNVRKEGK